MSFSTTTTHQSTSFYTYYPVHAPVPTAPGMETGYQGQPYVAPVQHPVYHQTTFVQPQHVQVPRMDVSSFMHAKTGELLAACRGVADSVLFRPQPIQTTHTTVYTAAPLYPAAPTTVYNIDMSRRETNILSNRTENHYHAPVNGRNRQQDDAGKRVLIAIIGFIVAGVAAYFLGRSAAQQEETQETGGNFAVLKDRWIQHKPAYQVQNPHYCDLVDGIIHKTESILARQQANRTHKVALAILFLSAGLAGILGAVVGSEVLMVSGLIMGAAATVFGLYKLGYYCFSKRDSKEAQIIFNDLVKAQQIPLNIYA